MNHIKVNSGNIESVAYDSDSQTLEIKFSHGGTYQYDNVSSGLHSALMEADSIGSFFHKHIKPLGGKKKEV